MMQKTFRMIIGLMIGLAVITYSVTAQTVNTPENHEIDPTRIRVITFSPYHTLFTWYGHSAIEVRNAQTGRGQMVNFGGFSFEPEDMVEFIFGRFVFWSFILDSRQALFPYQQEGRHIVFQELNLTPAQTAIIKKRLIYYLKPANRHYVYDHFKDNCSTKIRDIIDEALDGDLKRQTSHPSNLTYRGYIHRMMVNVPLLDFVLNFVLNDSVDQTITHWDSMFLPDRLMVEVQSANNPAIGGQGQEPLVKERIDSNPGVGLPFYAPEAIPVNTVTREIIWSIFLLVIIGPSAIFYMKGKRIFQRLYPGLISVFGLVFGTLGSILFFMMSFTEHKDTFWNENILLLNPITLLLFPIGLAALLGKLKNAFDWFCAISGVIAVCAIGLKIFPNFDQVNGQQLRVLLPVLSIVGFTGIIEIIKRKRSGMLLRKSQS